MSDEEYRLASAARSGLLYMCGVSGMALGDRVVMQNLEGVLEKIRGTLALSPSPSPASGRGEQTDELP